MTGCRVEKAYSLMANYNSLAFCSVEFSMLMDGVICGNHRNSRHVIPVLIHSSWVELLWKFP